MNKDNTDVGIMCVWDYRRRTTDHGWRSGLENTIYSTIRLLRFAVYGRQPNGKNCCSSSATLKWKLKLNNGLP